MWVGRWGWWVGIEAVRSEYACGLVQGFIGRVPKAQWDQQLQE